MPVSLGKKFEALIASQLDDCGVCFDRFKDDTAGYKGIRNICDFVVFFNGYLIYIECKTIHGKSFNIMACKIRVLIIQLLRVSCYGLSTRI